MREYSYFFAPKNVNIRQPPTGENPGVPGILYIGIRAQNLLLRNGDFYKDCGLFLQTDIDTLGTQEGTEYTTLVLSNTNDAERIDLIEELTFILIPVDPAATVPPFNTSYPTGLPYSPSIARPDFVERLKAKRFDFGTTETPIQYKTKPGSIRNKRQKRGAPTLG